ncbi:TcdA/TcdB pore-forming domain-containing protein [Yersinia enterocolitica]|uniref:TcdA/TcdB pore-forming domain-containing protein n=1 Tax=Yersinia enterocolitica TaxID=630 RepID=UPI003D03E304
MININNVDIVTSVFQNLGTLSGSDTNLYSEAQHITSGELENIYKYVLDYMQKQAFIANNAPDNFTTEIKRRLLDYYLQATLKNSWLLRGEFIKQIANIAPPVNRVTEIFVNINNTWQRRNAYYLTLPLHFANNETILIDNDKRNIQAKVLSSIITLYNGDEIRPSALTTWLNDFETHFMNAMNDFLNKNPGMNTYQYIMSVMENNRAYFSALSAVETNAHKMGGKVYIYSQEKSLSPDLQILHLAAFELLKESDLIKAVVSSKKTNNSIVNTPIDLTSGNVQIPGDNGSGIKGIDIDDTLDNYLFHKMNKQAGISVKQTNPTIWTVTDSRLGPHVPQQYITLHDKTSLSGLKSDGVNKIIDLVINTYHGSIANNEIPKVIEITNNTIRSTFSNDSTRYEYYFDDITKAFLPWEKLYDGVESAFASAIPSSDSGKVKSKFYSIYEDIVRINNKGFGGATLLALWMECNEYINHKNRTFSNIITSALDKTKVELINGVMDKIQIHKQKILNRLEAPPHNVVIDTNIGNIAPPKAIIENNAQPKVDLVTWKRTPLVPPITDQNKGHYSDVNGWAGITDTVTGTVDVRRNQNYDLNVIFVMENDEIIIRGVAQQIQKYPDKVTVIYLNSKGESRVVIGRERLQGGFDPKLSVRWQIAGHGYRGQEGIARRKTAILAGQTYVRLVENLYKSIASKHQNTNPAGGVNINDATNNHNDYIRISSPAKISLEACQLSQGADFDSFGSYFTLAWHALTGERIPVTARTSNMLVYTSTAKATEFNYISEINDNSGTASASVTNTALTTYTYTTNDTGELLIEHKQVQNNNKDAYFQNIDGQLFKLWPTDNAQYPDNAPEKSYQAFYADYIRAGVSGQENFHITGEAISWEMLNTLYQHTTIKIDNKVYYAVDLAEVGILIDGKPIRCYDLPAYQGKNIGLTDVSRSMALSRQFGTDSDASRITSYNSLSPNEQAAFIKLVHSDVSSRSSDGALSVTLTKTNQKNALIQSDSADFAPIPGAYFDELLSKTPTFEQGEGFHIIMQFDDAYHLAAQALYENDMVNSAWAQIGDPEQPLAFVHTDHKNKQTQAGSLPDFERKKSLQCTLLFGGTTGMANLKTPNMMADAMNQVMRAISGSEITKITIDLVAEDDVRAGTASLNNILMDRLVNETNKPANLASIEINSTAYASRQTLSGEREFFNTGIYEWGVSEEQKLSSLADNSLIWTSRNNQVENITGGSLDYSSLHLLPETLPLQQITGLTHGEIVEIAQQKAGAELIRETLLGENKPATRTDAQNMLVRYAELYTKANEWDKAVTDLKLNNKLNADWHVLLQPQTDVTGVTTLTAVNTLSNQTKKLVVTENIFHEFYDEVNELNHTIKKTFTSSDGKAITALDQINHIDSIHSMNAAFFVQGLMSIIKSGDDTSGMSADVAIAVKIEFWTGIVQTSISLVTEDTIAVIQAVKQAMSNEVIVASSMMSALKGISGGLGVVANLVTLGAQIFELVNIDNPYVKASVATNVAFSSISLGLSAVAMLGSAAVAAVAGGLAVVVSGIAIGVVALVSAFATVRAKFDAIDDQFNRLYDAVQPGAAYKIETGKEGEQYVKPDPYVVITRLDLSTNMYEYGLVQVNGMTNGVGHTYTAGWDHYFSTPEVDYKTYYDVYSAFDVSESHGFTFPQNTPVILPCTPNQKYTIKGKGQVPGVRNYNARGLRKLRSSIGSAFPWGFWASVDWAFTDMEVAYLDTTIDVVMPNDQTSVIIPSSPTEYTSKVKYKFSTIAGNAVRHICLPEKAVSVNLVNNYQDNKWLFDISSAFTKKGSIATTDIVRETSIVNGVEISTYKLFGSTIVLNEEEYRYDYSSGKYPPLRTSVPVNARSESVSILYSLGGGLSIIYDFKPDSLVPTFIVNSVDMPDDNTLKTHINNIIAHINVNSIIKALGTDYNVAVVIATKTDTLVGTINGDVCYLHSQKSPSLVSIINNDVKKISDANLASLFWTDNAGNVQCSTFIQNVYSGTIIFQGKLDSNNQFAADKVFFDHEGMTVLQKTQTGALTKDRVLNWINSNIRATTIKIVYSEDVKITGADSEGAIWDFDFASSKPGYIIPVRWEKFDCSYQYNSSTSTLMVQAFEHNDVITVPSEHDNPRMAEVIPDAAINILPSVNVQRVELHDLTRDVFIALSNGSLAEAFEICLPYSLSSYAVIRDGEDAILTLSSAGKCSVRISNIWQLAPDSLMLIFADGTVYSIDEIKMLTSSASSLIIGKDKNNQIFTQKAYGGDITFENGTKKAYLPMALSYQGNIVNQELCITDANGYMYRTGEATLDGSQHSLSLFARRIDSDIEPLMFKQPFDLSCLYTFKAEPVAGIRVNTETNRAFIVGMSGAVYEIVDNQGKKAFSLRGCYLDDDFYPLNIDMLNNVVFTRNVKVHYDLSGFIYIAYDEGEGARSSALCTLTIIYPEANGLHFSTYQDNIAFNTTGFTILGYSGRNLYLIPDQNPYGVRYELRNGKVYLDEVRTVSTISTVKAEVEHCQRQSILIDNVRGVRAVQQDNSVKLYFSGDDYSGIAIEKRGERTYLERPSLSATIGTTVMQKSLVINGYDFIAGSDSLKTGFKNARFNFVLNHGITDYMDFYFVSSHPSIASVDFKGEVKLLAPPLSNTEITISAISNNTQQEYSIKFTLNKWFTFTHDDISSDTIQSWIDSITNSVIPDASMITRNSNVRVISAPLWQEWGDISYYLPGIKYLIVKKLRSSYQVVNTATGGIVRDIHPINGTGAALINL